MQQNQEGVGASLAWRLENAHITLNMFQNRCPFLFNSSAFPSYYHFFASHSRIVWISFYLETSSLEPFSLFNDLIAFYYTKGKWQWRQGYLVCLESYHFDKKMFLYICLFLSPFNLKSLLNQRLFKSQILFSWLTNVSIFSNVIRLQLPQNS